jgi:hypothetical protein
MRVATVCLLLGALPGIAVAQDKPRVALQRVVPADDVTTPEAGDFSAQKSSTDDDSKPEPAAVEPVADAKAGAIKPPRVPEFFGDQAPIGSLRRIPNGQITGAGAIFVPSARYFKISDNNSPSPQTTDTFSFNYFYNLFPDINPRLGGGIQHTRIHREIFGLEWADDDGSCSVGLRLPIDTYNAANTVPGLDGTSTDIGDLTAFWKFRVWSDDETGSLLSMGLAVTPTTATGSFAGANHIKVFHNTSLQPFTGWIWRRDRFYVQGFTAVDAPTDLNDVVMLQNSVAMGYFLYQKCRGSGGITAVVPTVEVHVSTPLNHRGVLVFADPAGNPDQVNVTAGINFEYADASSAGVAFSTPVTGPRMFDFQILFQVRYRY